MILKSDYTEKSDFYFSHVRYDVIEELQKLHQQTPIRWERVLEVGCGSGTTGQELKKIFQIKEYIGIELMPEAAKVAQNNIDACYCGKVEDILNSELKLESFDAIIFLDVLEHIYDPWFVIKASGEHLNKGGMMVSSIPHIGFYDVVLRILFDKFEYNPNGGVLDSTHIRWFTKHTIKQLFAEYKIIYQKGKTVEFNRFLVKIFYFFIKPIFKRLFTIQYITIAQK